MRGTVMVAADTPAIGARVSPLTAPDRYAITDSSGRFLLTGLTAGHQVIVAALEGRNTATLGVTLRAGDTTRVTLRLGPPIELGRIVVSASNRRAFTADSATAGSKMPLPLRDLPQTVTVVSQAVIRSRDLTTMRDLADNVSSVVALPGYTGYGLNEQGFIIRGLATSYTQTALRDGFRDFAGVTPRDMVGVERVEFLKGPSSVLYGATGALGGVPNTVSKRPTADSFGELSLIVGGYGEGRATLDAGGPLNNDSTVRYRFAGAVERSRSWRPFNDGSYAFSLAPSVEVRPGANTTVLLSGEYTKRVYRLDPYLPLDATAFTLPTTLYYGEPALPLGRATGYRAQLILEHRFSPGLWLREGLSAIGGGVNDTSVSLDGVVPPDTVLRSSSVAQERSTDLASQTELLMAGRALGLRHRALVGLELSRETYAVSFTLGGLDPINLNHPVYGAVPTPGPLIDGRHPEGQVGVYVQDLVDLGAHVKAMAGARYDANTTTQYVDASAFGVSGAQASQSTAHVSPRAGLVYQPSAAVSVYAGWSQSYFPNLSCPACGDPPYFPPELGEQIEGGVRYELAGGRFTANLATYQLQKRNVLEPVPGDTLGRSFLSAKQRSRGVELDLQGTPSAGWNLIASYAYTDARQVHTVDSTIAPNQPLAGVPRQAGSLWTTVSPWRGLEAGVGLYFATASEATFPNSIQLPGWHRLDLMAAYAWSQWRVQLNLDNATDEKYYDAVTAFNLAIAPRPPRTLTGQITARF
ncbi:MAG TPA: TonB-dependent receptor [Gemmatimonadales bacterium]|nr:TonB-dependent receptor [Gemmatimonadales bacterium]